MQFYKYQGTGNDFILIDNRSEKIQLNKKEIEQLCHRRLGIGADGLMFLSAHEELDFEMQYFNADGNPGSLCGNGSRCMIQFAYDLGMKKKQFSFLASDGIHHAEILPNGEISLQLNDVSRIESVEQGLFIHTGSPHLVCFVSNLRSMDVYQTGKMLRHNNRFAPDGTNVNFAERTSQPDRLRVRTFERGVEDETHSCGTGVTACALALAYVDKLPLDTTIETKGGELMVQYQTTDFEHFYNIRLVGPAQKVFEGEINML